jgi:hypothetical protein
MKMHIKKLLFGIAALALLATASCTKTVCPGSSNSWTFGSNTFQAVTVTAKESTFDYALVAKDGNTSSPHTIVFFFNGSETPNATTPAAGTYKVVSNATAPGQVSFSVNGSTPSNVYFSTGNDNISATVSIVGDKVRISMPKAWAAGGGPDSVQVSAEITEN